LIHFYKRITASLNESLNDGDDDGACLG